MTWRPGFQDFFRTFRGRECIVVFKTGDLADWWIAPLNDAGSEDEAFQDLTDAEESELALAIGDFIMDYDD